MINVANAFVKWPISDTHHSVLRWQKRDHVGGTPLRSSPTQCGQALDDDLPCTMLLLKISLFEENKGFAMTLWVGGSD